MRMVMLLMLVFAPAAAWSDQYDRSEFGAWTTEGCLNTRARMLHRLHIGATGLLVENCRVIRGKWSSFYSGQTFTDASKIEIDHLIPLKWAWERGAKNWPRKKRIQFANDTAFLVVSAKGLNRSKSDKTPLGWMPPNKRARCRYVTRFVRGAFSYGLALSAVEREGLHSKGKTLCGEGFKLPSPPSS